MPTNYSRAKQKSSVQNQAKKRLAKKNLPLNAFRVAASGLATLTFLGFFIWQFNRVVTSNFNFLSFAAGQVYYISTTGSDTNTGNETAPLKTFAHALSLAEGGDTIIVKSGRYTEPLRVLTSGLSNGYITIKAAPEESVILDGQNKVNPIVDVRGSYISLEGFEITNSTGYCLDMGGDYITATNLKVHECQDHGIYTDGQHNVIRNNQVFRSVLNNSARTASSGWGSAIKVRVGGNDTLIEDNTVYNNYGEGIAVTRGLGAVVRNNTVYDNYAVNIYVDNSKDVLVEKNHSYCTTNSEFYRDGHPGAAIGIGEEYYDGWGAQLANITVKNNVLASCGNGIVYYGADVSGGGLDNVLIAYNTLWNGTETAISLNASTAKTRNTLIANNIVHQAGGKVAWIEDRTGITMQNNFWVGSVPDAWRNANGAGDKSGDPKFAGTPVATNPASFRLASTSPAVGGAALLTAVADDFESKLRHTVDGSGSDMGAIELVGQTASSSPLPSPSASPVVQPSAIPSPSPTPKPSPSPSPVASASPKASPSPSAVPSPSPVSSPTPAPSPTANLGPKMETTKLSAGRASRSYSATVKASDPNQGDVLTMSAINLPAGFTLGNCSQKYNRRGEKEELSCALTGTMSQPGEYDILFRAIDQNGAFDTINLTLKIR